jgi:integrase
MDDSLVVWKSTDLYCPGYLSEPSSAWRACGERMTALYNYLHYMHYVDIPLPLGGDLPMNTMVQLKPSRSEKRTVRSGLRSGRAKNADYRQREYLTEPEIEKLLTTAGESRNPVRDRLLILLAFRHALRVSELVDLRWQQVHLDTATIHIRRAKNGTPGIHGLQGDELRLLRALRREHPHADFVFLSERKAPFSISAAQKLIERLGESARLRFPIHAHMLRHAAGYALAARGVDTRTLQAFMGHRSIANTVIYTAVADKRVRNIWGK